MGSFLLVTLSVTLIEIGLTANAWFDARRISSSKHCYISTGKPFWLDAKDTFVNHHDSQMDTTQATNYVKDKSEKAIDVDKFYSDGYQYWLNNPATLEGMLGDGFSHLHQMDIDESMAFLRPLIQGEHATIGHHRACDCGAGIGRVSKDLLLPLFDTVDLVDLNPRFIERAKEMLHGSSVEKFIVSGLQNFTPEPGRYDVIWIQWVLGQLTDEDLVKFFHRCRRGLKKGGIIVFKENVSSSKRTWFDDEDSTYTRPLFAFEKLIADAGLKVIMRAKEIGFPDGLYPVWMYALQ